MPDCGPVGGSRLTFPESTRAITRISNLQAQLLDYTGHVARGQGRDDVRITLDEIQRLRELVGWKSLDMTGRWRRPRTERTAT
jgi:hypothetical protein